MTRLWLVGETELIDMLERVQAGEDPALVLAEEYANAEVENHGEEQGRTG